MEGIGTVVEGQPYELDLTAEYPDSEPGAINHWLVDWNDGTGGLSDVISYSYPTGADPTQPLMVTHVFNAGIASPTVTATAVDSVNGSFAADGQAVAVTPISPGGVSASASGSTLTVHWTNASNISTGTTLLLSTDDSAFYDYGSAAAGATSGTISDCGLWIRTIGWKLRLPASMESPMRPRRFRYPQLTPHRLC